MVPTTTQDAPGAGPDAGTCGQKPGTKDEALQWVTDYTGVKIARAHVCADHTPPATFFWEMLQRPPLALVLGPRGGGKSFLSAIDTHIQSRFQAKHGPRILGGSRAQSEQVYRALREAVYEGSGPKGSDADSIARLLKGEAVYHNGSDVAILAASSRSVRGPHVPSLRLDEVDEIDPELREAAMGMCMNRYGSNASVVMTSTWHRLNGPMSQLMDRAAANEFPLYTFCAFEILEQCPDERSGRWVGGDAGYEHCPACPLKPWCHAERDHRDGRPLAKRSDGHYAIDSLVQKVRSVSARAFESDYLCKGPRSEGVWFPTFDPDVHVDGRAEFDPRLDVCLAVDSGVFTGAVFFQIAEVEEPTGKVDEVRVFADYLVENRPAEQVARELVDLSRTLCQGRLDLIATDPAGGARNAVGPTVLAEYERGGLKPIARWPAGPVADGMALVESFLNPADGRPRLLLHPRCKATTRALQSYRRAKRAGQWQDYPEDPQHPHEDLVDALRGGLRARFPNGRAAAPNLKRILFSKIF
jgi:hypothetical protein